MITEACVDGRHSPLHSHLWNVYEGALEVIILQQVFVLEVLEVP